MDRDPRGPIRFGIFEVDPETRELRKGGVKVRLQDQPFQILVVLLEQPGQIVSREELRKQVWPADTFVDFDHGLYSAIKRLRDVLGDSAETPRYIETVSKRGYRFIAPVEKPVPITEIDKTSAASERDLHLNLASKSLGRGYLTQGKVVVLFVVILVLSLVGIAAYPRFGSPTKAIAVLPFSYPANNSFLSGVSDKLTGSLFLDLNTLGKLGLKTKARPYVDRFRDSKADPIEIGKQLDTDFIIVGSLHEKEGQLSIDVDLISVTDGSSLWAARDLRWEPFEVESARRDIFSELLGRLPVNLNHSTREAILHTHPDRKPDPKAEELAAKAQELFWMGTPESFKRSIQLNKDAISVDEQFAPPYGGIASAYAAMANLEMIPPQEAKAKSVEWARRGLKLDDVDFGSLIALHTVHMCLEWTEETIRENDLANGRFQEARERSLRFQAENPKSPASYLFLGADLMMERRYKEAAEQFKIALELDPQGAWAHYHLANAYLYQNRYNDAILEFDVSRKDLPVHGLAGAIVARAQAGRVEEAKEKAEELKRLSYFQYVSPLMFARVAVALGDREAAFGDLKTACNNRVPPLLNIKIDPTWDHIRQDPRFGEIVHCVGL
jgi:DNA-binding winged helix-turn-helix (wHTH) protein/TolB-like protein/tetratricopeptide (TPR) repeat protein